MTSATVEVPFVDLRPQHAEIADEVRRGFDEVVSSSTFIGGPVVEAFEREFAAYCRTQGCVGVANGTDALELAIRALGLSAGDEVVVPANSFIASALAVLRAGARPVLVDCDPTYLLIDPEATERAITPRTRAIMPVHLFGQLAPMDALVALAERRGLAVIEDAAQSHGATQHGKPMGAWGRLTGTSFYPGKNLGAWGDAGAVIGKDPALLAKVRALRNYGSEVKYHHPEVGFNSRLDPLQAVVLRAKLKRLDGWNAQRGQLAAKYLELLPKVPQVVPPSTLAGNVHAWHLFVVRVARRDAVKARLDAAGIGTVVHYPVPIHLQGGMSGLGHARGAFPSTERAADEMLSLPMYPGLTTATQEHVVEQLRLAVAGAGR